MIQASDDSHTSADVDGLRERLYALETSLVDRDVDSLMRTATITQYALAGAMLLVLTAMISFCVSSVWVRVACTTLVGGGLAVLCANRQGMINRRVHVFVVASFVYVSLKAAQLQTRRKHMSQDEEDRLWDHRYRVTSRYLFLHIKALRGFWVKLGQYLSSRADALPEAFVSELGRLQDAMPSEPFEAIKHAVETELKRPLNDLFASFDKSPLASASIAQVHRATLKQDGTKVVVKVQHAHIDRIMRQDVSDLSAICWIVAKLEPRYDFRPVISEWQRLAIKELDFTIEGSNQRRAREALIKANIQVSIPRLVDSLITKRVIVMEFAEGFKITDSAQLLEHRVTNEELTKVFGRLVDAFAYGMFCDGHFNGDPHPGNILLHVKEQEGDRQLTVTLLDWGLAKTFEPPGQVAIKSKYKRRSRPMMRYIDSRLAFAKLVACVAAKNSNGLIEAFEELGFEFFHDEIEPQMGIEVMRFVMRDTQTKERAASITKRRMRADMDKFQREQKEKKRDPVDAFPGEIIFFFRVTFLLHGLASRLAIRYAFLSTLERRATEAVNRHRLETCHTHDIDDNAALLRIRDKVNHDGGDSCPIRSMPEYTKAYGLHKHNGAVSGIERALQECMDELWRDEWVLGAQCSVYVSSQKVADVCVGQCGPLDPMPVRPDTVFNTFSVTKAIGATAVLQLVDRNVIHLDTKIADIWPGFGQNGKENITVAQALAHTAGLYHLIPPNMTTSKLCDFNLMAHEIAKAKPLHEPGTRQVYHYITYGWLIGGIIQHALQTTTDTHTDTQSTGTAAKDHHQQDGGSIVSCFVRNSIAAPLGLADELIVGLTPDVMARRGKVASLHKPPSTTVSEQEVESAIERLEDTLQDGEGGTKETSDASQLFSRLAGPLLKELSGREHLLDPHLFDNKQVKQACILAANGHCSARALAKLFSALGHGDVIRSPDLMAMATRRWNPQPTAGNNCDQGEQDRPPLEDALASPFEQTEDNKLVIQQMGLGVFVFGFKLRQVGSGEVWQYVRPSVPGEVRPSIRPGGRYLHAYGHAGLNGCLALYIPALEVSFAFCHNNVPEMSEPSAALGSLYPAIRSLARVCEQLGVPLEILDAFGQSDSD